MSELAAFLLAQIAADEATARAATDGGFGWRLTDRAGANEVWADRCAAGHDAFMVATTATRLNPNPGERGYSDAAHIARHDPARVLAEVAAKRAIVAAHEGWHVCPYVGAGHNGYTDFADDADDMGMRPCPTLRALASVYEGAPGWQEEWR